MTTTAAVAHKKGYTYIGLEQLDKHIELMLRPSQLDLQLIQLPVTELTDILSPKNKKKEILESSSLASRCIPGSMMVSLPWLSYQSIG